MKEQVKHCRTCKKVKPIDEFYLNRTSRDGHQAECKPCQKERDRKRRARGAHAAKKTAGRPFVWTRETDQALRLAMKRIQVTEGSAPKGYWKIIAAQVSPRLRPEQATQRAWYLKRLGDREPTYEHARPKPPKKHEAAGGKTNQLECEVLVLRKKFDRFTSDVFALFETTLNQLETIRAAVDSPSETRPPSNGVGHAFDSDEDDDYQASVG